MVYQNYNGIDLDRASSLIDETEFQNIHTADPSQRTGCGNNDVVSSLSVSDPEFYIPSGPSAPCINIFSVSIENTYIYNNYFTTFTLSNFTSYNWSSFQK